MIIYDELTSDALDTSLKIELLAVGYTGEDTTKDKIINEIVSIYVEDFEEKVTKYLYDNFNDKTKDCVANLLTSMLNRKEDNAL